MSDAIRVRLVEATRTDNGVVLAFHDGETAFYPAALLYSMLLSAQRIGPSVEDDL